MVAGSSVPTQVDGCRVERLEHEALLFCAATARTVYLNDTAALVWDLCDGRRTIREIVDLLRAAYPESAGALASDVEQAVERFRDYGALRLA